MYDENSFWTSQSHSVLISSAQALFICTIYDPHYNFTCSHWDEPPNHSRRTAHDPTGWTESWNLAKPLSFAAKSSFDAQADQHTSCRSGFCSQASFSVAPNCFPLYMWWFFQQKMSRASVVCSHLAARVPICFDIFKNILASGAGQRQIFALPESIHFQTCCLDNNIRLVSFSSNSTSILNATLRYKQLQSEIQHSN